MNKASVTTIEGADGTVQYEVSYDVSSESGETQSAVQVSDGTLSSVSSALGNGFIVQSEITDVISGMERATGTTISDDEQLTFAKTMVKRAVSAYAASDDANDFTLEECGIKLTSAFSSDELSTMKAAATELQQSEGDDATFDIELVLPYFNVKITSACSNVLSFLSQLETHGTSVTSAATTHSEAIDALTTVAAVTSYDYSTGWPEGVVGSL